VLTVLWTFAFTADDPFITLRYAANLVHGYGLTFNSGQYVQGFTSPLHIVVAVVAYVLPGGNPLFKLKVASFIFGVLALREASILIYGIAIPRWARRTACVTVATSWMLSFASGNGLETTIVVWLMIALARRLILDGPSRSKLAAATIAFFLVVTRLDALAPLVVMALAGLVVERGSSPVWVRVRWFGGAVLGAAVVMLFGLIYFGSALPNTYYAKGMSLGRSLSYGLGYLLTPINGGAPAKIPDGISAFVVIVEVVFFALGVFSIAKFAPRCTYLVAIVVGQVLYILKTGGDWMPGGRFLAVAVIPLSIVEAFGLVAAAIYLRRLLVGQITKLLLLIGGGCIVMASFLPLASVRAPVWSLNGVSDAALLSTAPDPQFAPRIAIRENLPIELSCLRPGQLVATSEIGYLGFARLDLRILDIRGLADKTIAMHTASKYKYPWGVHEPNLLNPKSVVGREILRENPLVIATFDSIPKHVALNGRYHLVKVNHYGRYELAYYSRYSSIDSCLRGK
jgi:hypothetical protein